MKKPEGSKFKTLGVTIPILWHEEITQTAMLENKSVSELVRSILEPWILQRSSFKEMTDEDLID